MNQDLYRFADLPPDAKSAVRVFCLEISDEDSGITATSTAFQNHVDKYRFSLETISMATAIERYMKTESAFDTFEHYHHWYLKSGPVPKHKTRWPVIESPFEDEWLEDGWHRFHCYVEAGDTSIQVLKFHPLELQTPADRLAQGERFTGEFGKGL